MNLPPLKKVTPSRIISILSGSMCAPLEPAEDAILPQLGSPPKTAHFTRSEPAIAPATFDASDTVLAPFTCTSINLVAPSPSITIIFARSAETASRFLQNVLKSLPFRSIFRLPASPLASSTAVSLVLMSPSTVIALNEPATFSASALSMALLAILASVMIYDSIVAMSGFIIPAPLATPVMVTFLLPMRKDLEDIFGNLSVVIMPSAASASPFADIPDTSSSKPPRSGCICMNSPIIPVEDTSTLSSLTPRILAALFTVLRASLIPRFPVIQLALPELTTTALT